MEILTVISLTSSVLLLSGVFLLILGILQLFSKSWFNWRVTQLKKTFGKQLKVSESANKINGVILITTGTFLLGVYLFLQQELNSIY